MKTIVLVGGGHAHLHCLEQLSKKFPMNVHVALISPSIHQYYSGMFSGFTEGIYRPEEIRINLRLLCEKIGVEFMMDSIVAVDPKSKKLTGAQGAVYDYDIVSFDIGSLMAIPEKMNKQMTAIKPNFLFPEKLLQIRKSPHPVIVGGGSAGVELALAIQAYRKRQQLPLNPVLLSSGSLLSGSPSRITEKIEAIANKKMLHFGTGQTVIEIAGDRVTTENGKSFTQSAVLWLTGPKSFGLFKDSELTTDDAGFLLVEETLQNKEHPDIFGAGDCVAISRYFSLAKNGVYAVRQGPVLWNNLKSHMNGAELKPFIPQKRYMSILSTGGREAILLYGGRSVHGKIPWLIKQSIDRKFIKRYKRLYE